MPLVEDSEGAATVKKFELDAAHCFDPNEEFKLRSLIASIGLERLQQCIAYMAEKLSQPPGEEGGAQGGWFCRASQAAVSSQLAAAAPLLSRAANESTPVQAPEPAPSSSALLPAPSSSALLPAPSSAALLPAPAAAESAAAPRVGRIYEDAEWLNMRTLSGSID